MSNVKKELEFVSTSMAVDEFIKITDHPRQRDTVRHAAMAKKKHLKESSPTQQRVSVAIHEGKSYKLDGHTRAYLWASGELGKPKTLQVDVYDCRTPEELLEIYNHFDNKNAVETISDMLSGAVRQAGITFQSSLMKKHMFTAAMRLAYSFSPGNSMNAKTISTYELVHIFKDELILLDSIDPSPTIFKAYMITGALLGLKKHGKKALPFFSAVNNNRGTKGPSVCDPVQALWDIVHRRIGASNGSQHMYESAAQVISCLERHLNKQTYMVTRSGVSVKRTDLSSYGRSIKWNDKSAPASDDGDDFEDG